MLGNDPDDVGLVGAVGVSEVGRGFEQVRRRSWSSRSPAGVRVNPRQPREARSSTAQTRLVQLVSPGSRPMTLTRRRYRRKVRSMKLECRTRL
jgi:hypothetical protein